MASLERAETKFNFPEVIIEKKKEEDRIHLEGLQKRIDMMRAER
jgi:hypothetical protein